MFTAPVLFVNIGWMKRYAGTRGDRTLGGFGYLKDHAVGHEAWNFAPLRGSMFGYIPRSLKVNLRKLGGSTGDTEVHGVTVVWIARSPQTERTVVVGWYRNATVFVDAFHFKLIRAPGFKVGYQVTAPAADAVLLDVDQRLFEIPTAKVKGNLGHSPVWYGGTPAFVAKTLAHIQAGGRLAPRKVAKFSPRNSDPEVRKMIEVAAVKHAAKYFRSPAGGGRSVKSVEDDCVGWDLTVTAASGEVLKVEVKGLSGTDVVVELTPNEFQKMCSAQHRHQYVIYIVTSAGTPRAKSHIFRYDARARSKTTFVTDDGRVIAIKKLVGARLSALD